MKDQDILHAKVVFQENFNLLSLKDILKENIVSIWKLQETMERDF